MAIPARRVPGWVLVAVIVVAGVVVAASVVLLRPQPVLGTPLLLIRADGTISATPANATVPADFGPHCAQWRWLGPQRILTVDADVDLSGTAGVILQRYDPGTENFQWDGGDAVRAQASVASVAWEVTSPIDRRVLATFDRTDSNVTVDGVTYVPGDVWTMTFDYDVLVNAQSVHIGETITFRNEGIVVPHLTPARACA